MILAALALASAAAPMPDLDAAIANYATLVSTAQTERDRVFVEMSGTNVCRIAYRYTLTRDDQTAADAIIAYKGPNADGLKLACSLYFRQRAL